MARDLEPYQRRVVAERAELDARRARLAVFMADREHMVLLSRPERLLLLMQRDLMRQYSDVLGWRIEEWEREE